MLLAKKLFGITADGGVEEDSGDEGGGEEDEAAFVERMWQQAAVSSTSK